MRSKDEDDKSEESKEKNDKSIDPDTTTSENPRIGDAEIVIVCSSPHILESATGPCT